MDGWLGKARMGGDEVGANPTDRGKNGTKKSVVVEEQGGPLGAVVAPANRHDSKRLKATLEAVVVERPRPTSRRPQHLCLDKAYDNDTSQEVVAAEGYVNHTARICRGEWMPTDPGELKRWLRQRKKQTARKKGGPRRRRTAGW